MSEAIAMSSDLNYGDIRQRAVAARAVTLKLPATNGSSFSMTQSIKFQLPGSNENGFYDMSKTGILLTLTNTAAANGGANDGYLPGASAGYGLVQRKTITSSGATLSDIQNYNVLVDALMTAETSKDYNMNILANMSGAGSAGANKVGKVVAENSANPLTIFLPFIACSVAQTQPQKMIPAFGAPIDITYYLDSVQNAFVSAGTPVISITNAQLVTSMTIVSPETGRLIDELTQGVYRMLCTDYRSASAVVTGTGAATSATSTLGFSMSSLDKVLWVARSADSQVQANQSIGARSTASASEFQLFVGGKAFPDVPVVLSGTAGVAGYGAEGMAHLLMSSGALHNFNHASQFGTTIDGAADDDRFALVDSDGSTEAKTGSFVAGVSLDSMPTSDGLFSGENCISKTVQMKHSFSALPAKAFEINYFASYTSQLMLNMRGTRIWEVSV